LARLSARFLQLAWTAFGLPTWAAGNYSVTLKDKTIEGNWFRILKRESGTWKIAMQSFARAAAMDGPPPATGSSATPADNK
jgi:hypothetical protein